MTHLKQWHTILFCDCTASILKYQYPSTVEFNESRTSPAQFTATTKQSDRDEGQLGSPFPINKSCKQFDPSAATLSGNGLETRAKPITVFLQVKAQQLLVSQIFFFFHSKHKSTNPSLSSKWLCPCQSFQWPKNDGQVKLFDSVNWTLQSVNQTGVVKLSSNQPDLPSVSFTRYEDFYDLKVFFFSHFFLFMKLKING